jgi:hypothetical protein
LISLIKFSGLITPNSVIIHVIHLCGTLSNAKFTISSQSGASGHNSFPLLVSIHTLSVVSTFNRLHTIYNGTQEFQADNQIEKLQILLITVQSGLIQSAHKNISFISTVFQSVLSTKNHAELSTTIVSGTQAFNKSNDVFLH